MGSHSLDPADWQAFRTQAHRMLDDMIDSMEHIRDRPVWQPIPPEVRARFRSDLPEDAGDLAAVHEEFLRYILPFATGNAHPGFMGWVHGGGNPDGMLAEMLVDRRLLSRRNSRGVECAPGRSAAAGSAG